MSAMSEATRPDRPTPFRQPTGGRLPPRSVGRFPNSATACIAAAVLAVVCQAPALAQSKPVRVKPPELDDARFRDIFFEDVRSQLRGELPTNRSQRPNSGPPSTDSSDSPASGETRDPMGWKTLISPSSLEDLVKEAKLRLDRQITTPAAFNGGGFKIARREFSLLALLFAIIENYGGDVRWQEDASAARERLARAAANTKVGSIQTYQEAKQRLVDLDDLIRGSSLNATPGSEIDWSNLIDRVPLMRLLEWAYQEELSKKVASESEFKANKDAIRRYAELIAVLGKTMLFEDMPDATDADYQQFTEEMIQQALQVRLAAETDDADSARTAAGAIGQSCSACHDNFR